MIGSRLARSTRRAGQSGCAGPIEATSTTSPGKRTLSRRRFPLAPVDPGAARADSRREPANPAPGDPLLCSLGVDPDLAGQVLQGQSASRIAWRSRSLTTITSRPWHRHDRAS